MMNPMSANMVKIRTTDKMMTETEEEEEFDLEVEIVDLRELAFIFTLFIFQLWNKKKMKYRK